MTARVECIECQNLYLVDGFPTSRCNIMNIERQLPASHIVPQDCRDVNRDGDCALFLRYPRSAAHRLRVLP